MKKLLGLFKTQTVKDSMVIMVGLGVTAIVGFVYTIILARVLGPNIFGIYSAITAFAAIVYTMGDLGVSSAVINLLPKNTFKRYFVLSTGFWLQFFIILVALVSVYVVTVLRRFIIPGAIATDLFLAGAIAVNYLFIAYAQGVFTAEKKFWSYSLSQVLDSVLKIVIVFALFKLNKLSITTALVSNAISTLVALLLTFGKELYQIEFDIDKKVVQAMFNFAKWIAVSRVFSVFISRIDVILLNILSGSYHAGIYSAASRVTLFFALLVSGLGSVVNPRFSSFDSQKKVTAYLKKLLLLVTGLSVVMIVFAILAGPIITFVFGNSYSEAVNVFRYLTVAMIPFLFSLVTTPPLLYTYNQPAFYAQITALQVTGIVILDIVLIPYLGAMAPVIAMAVTNIFVVSVSSVKLISLIHGKTLDQR